MAKRGAGQVARKIVLSSTLLLIAATLLSTRFATEGSRRMKPIPRLVLWAWERPEDLRFINPQNTAIAFLAATIRLQAGDVVIRPRFQPLLVPDKTALVAVARIEADPLTALDQDQIAQSVAAIANVASLPRVVAVQVDFDATVSQRAFYRDLLIELRQRLGPAAPISITALASWCLDDDWISGLPIDEAVPMLFRMGAGTGDVVTHLTSGKDFRVPLCHDSLGISSDERWASLPRDRRLYVFHPESWTQAAELAFLREVDRWH